MFSSPVSPQIVLSVLVLAVLAVEYMYIVRMWMRPDYGYRILLGTVILFTICSEVEREFGSGWLSQIPRVITLSITVLFPIFEEVMLSRRKERARTRTVYVENALYEDSDV